MSIRPRGANGIDRAQPAASVLEALASRRLAPPRAAARPRARGSPPFGSAGALGDGAAILSRTPLQVTGLSSGVLSVGTTSAAYHTCAVTIGGAAYCWGNNSAGQLGNGSYAAATVPVPVTGLSSGIAAIVP